MYQFIGKLKSKSEIKSGVSQAGREWKKISFVVMEKGNNKGNPVEFSTLNSDAVMFISDTALDTEIQVSFGVDGREYNGKYYVNLTAYGVETYRQQEIVHNGAKQAAQVYGQEYSRPQPAVVEEDEGDMLPF